jgi:DNA-binding NtrC family response regulator
VKVDRAITIAPERSSNPALTKLGLLLADAQVATEVKTSAEDACAALVMAEHEALPCLLVDATSSRDLEHLSTTVPHIAPVAFAANPTRDAILTAFRMGAFDFLDTETENDASILVALERSAAETRRRIARRAQLSGMRALVEDFLRTLVKTERRSLELEERLVAGEVGRGEVAPALDPDRVPCVLIVDDDEEVVELLVDLIGRNGLETIRALRGVDAIEAVAGAVEEGDPIDLVLIDKNLPDVDGVRLISRLRQIQPGTAAMVMTGFASTESAIDAADLGVVGYVLKPFDDVEALIGRVIEAANHAMQDRRERRYLDRFKERHSEFLLRYRQLAAQLDKLQ